MRGGGLLVAPRVLRAPEGPAAREARRPRFARRCASKPARALRTLRRPSHQWGLVAVRRLGASARSPARPTAHGHRSLALRTLRRPSHQWGRVADAWLARCSDVQLWLSISNFARNSSKTHSNIEFASSELQRFWGVSKNDRDKLRARFGWLRCRRHQWAPQPSSLFLPAPFAPAAVGVLHYMKPSGGALPACRTLV